MSHKAKEMIDVQYNPEDSPMAYNNSSIQSRLSEYTLMAKEIHRLECHPTIQDLDGEVMIRV